MLSRLNTLTLAFLPKALEESLESVKEWSNPSITENAAKMKHAREALYTSLALAALAGLAGMAIDEKRGAVKVMYFSVAGIGAVFAGLSLKYLYKASTVYQTAVNNLFIEIQDS